jgi:hypothetical protein
VNRYVLNTGFGLGSLLFGAALSLGFGPALALALFRTEAPQLSPRRADGGM